MNQTPPTLSFEARLRRNLDMARVTVTEIRIASRRCHVTFPTATDARRGGIVLRGMLSNVTIWQGVEQPTDQGSWEPMPVKVWHATGRI